jgi:hypothetical protein
MIVQGLLVGVLGIVGVILVGLEFGYRRRLGNKLNLTAGHWRIEDYEPDYYRLVGNLEFVNLTPRLDVMIPEVWAEVTLLSSGSVADITTQSTIIPRYKNASPRDDGYWESYIVMPNQSAAIEVQIEICGKDLTQLSAIWVQMHYFTYGRAGRLSRLQHIVVPLKFPSPEEANRWRPVQDADLLPIKTHLLTHLDDPVAIVQRYVLPHAQPGDIVTIGESPLAIMQGRFRHPSQIQPGWLATRLCYMFYTTSSLATACGLQTLIDIVGAPRVFLAFLGGMVTKPFGIKGMFYRLAGEQARLIDDVTGTIPPYDKFIVLGPDNPQAVCDQIRDETGLEVAVVDVNDLRRVKILAATDGVSYQFLEQALISNPAGNANEQTPLVLIRPTEVGIVDNSDTVASPQTIGGEP